MTNTYFADALILVALVVGAIGFASGKLELLVMQLALVVASALYRIAGNHNQGEK